jgi:WD40 repeat protein
VWDFASGTLVNVLEGHTESVHKVLVTQDGQLISAAGDDTVRVWEDPFRHDHAALERERPRTGREVTTAVTPDGRHLVVADRHSLGVWEVDQGRQLPSIQGSSAPFAITYDAQSIVSADQHGCVRIAQLGFNVPRVELREHMQGVSAIAVTLDGKCAVLGGRDGTIRVRDLESSHPGEVLGRHDRPVTALTTTHDTRYVISGAEDGAVWVWDLWKSRTPRRMLSPCKNKIGSLAVTPDARHVVAVDELGLVQVWEFANGQPLPELKGQRQTIAMGRTIGITGDGRHVVAADPRGLLWVWDLALGSGGDPIRCWIGESSHAPVLNADSQLVVRLRPGGGFDKYRFEIHGTTAG